MGGGGGGAELVVSNIAPQASLKRPGVARARGQRALSVGEVHPAGVTRMKVHLTSRCLGVSAGNQDS